MPHTATGPVLTIDVERIGEVVVVHCHGRLVAGATDVLYLGVKELIPGTKRIILDLTDLKHTDSMGIGTLVRLYVSAKAAGCSLELINEQADPLAAGAHRSSGDLYRGRREGDQVYVTGALRGGGAGFQSILKLDAHTGHLRGQPDHDLV